MALDLETEENLRKMLVVWYGSQATDWRLNEQTVLVAAQILEASGQCSSVFRYVPTPAGAFTGGGQMAKMAYSYAKDAVKRAATDEQLYYSTCMKRKALEYRAEFDRALHGY